MAGIPYPLNYLAPQARDAARDILEQLRINAAGPYPELHVAADSLTVGDHLYYRPQGSAWKVLECSPESDYVRAVEMRHLDYAPQSQSVWLDLRHGYESLSEEEVAAEVAEMEARAIRDTDDRYARWGGGWDD